MTAVLRRHTSRIAAGASIVAATLVIAACGSSGGKDSGAGPGTGGSVAPPAKDQAVVALLPAKVKSSGVLTVGTEAQYPPFEFYQGNNKTITGFDAQIASSLAAVMGLKLELNDAAFDSIIPSLASGRYDLGMSGFTVTAERIKQVDFVTYYYEGDGLMVKAGNPKKLTIGTALCGARIAVLKGSTQAVRSVPALTKACQQAGKSTVSATVVPGSSDLGLSLQSGRVDGVLTDGSNAAYTSKLSKGKFEVATGQPYNPAPFGIASAKGNGMDKAVQKALEVMVSNGSYGKALDAWGMKAGAVTTPKINEVSD